MNLCDHQNNVIDVVADTSLHLQVINNVRTFF